MNFSIKQAALPVLASCLFMGFAAHADDFKIGFVNTDRIFKEAVPAKNAQSKLQTEFAKREKELNEQGKKLKTLSDAFEKNAPTLSEAERNRKQRELIDADQEFQRKRREFQEDLNARKNEELAAVLERANKAIREIAEKEKFDVIMQEAVYINPKHDMTEKVIKALNSASGSNGK